MIITEVNADEYGAPVIVGQASVGGLAVGSSIGTLGGAETVPAAIPNGMTLPDGMVMTVVEVFSQQDHLIGGFASGGNTQVTLSSRASF